METRDQGGRPTPEEARAALETANSEEEATRNRPVPAWYYPVLAVAVLALFLLNALDRPEGVLRGVAIGLTLAIALSVAVLVGRVSFRQTGYHGVRTRWGWVLGGAAIAAALAMTPVLLADSVGTWIWVPCGAVLAALIAGSGIAYQRRTGRG